MKSAQWAGRLICVSAAASDAMLSDRLLCSQHQDDDNHNDDEDDDNVEDCDNDVEDDEHEHDTTRMLRIYISNSWNT